MLRTFSIACRAAVFTLILTGLVYPLLVTGLAQLLFPAKANGSLVRDERGQVVGSELIGQRFSHPAYFQSRLYRRVPGARTPIGRHQDGAEYD